MPLNRVAPERRDVVNPRSFSYRILSLNRDPAGISPLSLTFHVCPFRPLISLLDIGMVDYSDSENTFKKGQNSTDGLPSTDDTYDISPMMKSRL